MQLAPQDLILFYRLHPTLMFFVNQRLQVLPDDVADPEEFSTLPPNVRLEVRNALLEHLDLIQEFVDENPANLPENELDIVGSWQHLVHGKFYVFRKLKKHTIFLTSDEEPIAYGVLSLADPFEALIGPHLPVLVETVLLPFKDVIVYDGLMMGYNVSFGPGVRRSLDESYKEAKARHGIVTSLPMSNAPSPPKPRKSKSAKKQASKDKKEEALSVILGLIDDFCKEHLNEEYAELCRELAEKLARKRPSPLLSGKPEAWASGIVRTIGWVNFLHDKSQAPHVRLGDIDAAFGISESTGAAKSSAIRKMLKIRQMDPGWTLPSRLDDNPLVWLLEVNGLVMDVRDAPREVQEIAFNKGLIPYVPADRQRDED